MHQKKKKNCDKNKEKQFAISYFIYFFIFGTYKVTYKKYILLSKIFLY